MGKHIGPRLNMTLCVESINNLVVPFWKQLLQKCSVPSKRFPSAVRTATKNMLCMYRKWINRINVMHQNRKAAYHKCCVSVGLCALFPSALASIARTKKMHFQFFQLLVLPLSCVFATRARPHAVYVRICLSTWIWRKFISPSLKCAHSHPWSRTEVRVNIKCRHFNRSMNGYFQLNTFRLHNNSKNGTSAHIQRSTSTKKCRPTTRRRQAEFIFGIQSLHSDRFVV